MLKHCYSKLSAEQLIKNPSALAVFNFSGHCTPSQPGIINTGLAPFANQTCNEVWELEGQEVSRGQSGECHWSKSEELLCASVWASSEECSDIESTAKRYYDILLTFLNDAEYPYPLRFWNYLPKINDGEGDNEQYKLFCNGRLKSFQANDISPNMFSAASALGHYTQGAAFYVFASKKPGKHYENPVQQSAFEYPRQYGKSSPSFARATAYKHGAGGETLFVSGTASIIGHETIHLSSTENQLATIFSNIDKLIEHCEFSKTALQSIKVYLRHQQDYASVQQMLEKQYPNVASLIVQADVCRDNLLIEIEAHAQK